MTHYVEFDHPKHGNQCSGNKTLNDILGWLSYMVAFHSITNIKLFKVGDNGEKEQIQEFKIPKW